NFNGADTLTLTTNDQGNTGSGGAKSDTDTVDLTVNAVNDAPVNSVPAAQATNEDTAKTLSGASALSVSDVDVAETVGGKLRLTLSVSHGTLSLSGTSGLDFSCGLCAGDGTADAAMTFTASAADANAALDGLVYTPASNFNGADTLTLTTNDQGNTGSGGAKSDTDTVDLTVNAVNDAPVNSVPAAQATNEDTAKTLSGASALSVSDVDVAETVGGKLRLSLSVSHGTLSLSGTSGLDFSCGLCAGDGTADAAMTFTASAADANAALDGLVYTPASNFNGADTLTLTTNDQGNTGSGGAKSDTDSVDITVNAVNDAPVFTKGADQTVFEDAGAQTVTGWATAISAGPADESSQVVSF